MPVGASIHAIGLKQFSPKTGLGSQVPPLQVKTAGNLHSTFNREAGVATDPDWRAGAMEHQQKAPAAGKAKQDRPPRLFRFASHNWLCCLDHQMVEATG